MKHNFSGKFVMFDGLDGIGKGVAIKAVVDYLKSQGLKVFDLHDYWSENHDHPDFEKDNMDFDVLVSSEPTYAGVGITIRKEIFSKNNRNYSAMLTAESYSIDRIILYKRVIIPALKAGKIVIQSRSVSTSLVYQPVQSEGILSMQDIAQLEGNAFCLQYLPDLFVITTIDDANEVMRRLSDRNKDDNCIFENLKFQMSVKPIFEGDELKSYFKGSQIKFLDAGVSIDHTKSEAVRIYKEFIGN